MRGERALLRIGEYLVGRACQHLPRKTREDRYREWVAELPAILHDPEVRLTPLRAVRMLGYAADTLRGAALTSGRARHRPARTWALVLGLVFAGGLTFMAWSARDTVQAPGHWGNYVDLAWSLMLAAWSSSQYARPAARVTGLISASYCPAGMAYFICQAVQAPGDWLNYLFATVFFVPSLLWLIWPRGATVKRNAVIRGSSQSGTR